MGIIALDLFMTLDGVYQGPGGADEDTSGGFTFGGWQAAFADAESGAAIMSGINRMDALLLGRRTYDIFAGYWPLRGDSNPIAEKFNSMDKFVVSRTLDNASWDGTTVLAAGRRLHSSRITTRRSILWAVETSPDHCLRLDSWIG
ncbi:dihydrofolate reductase family protein [Arthrobacter koreensis]|uniref:dihydrofolate reductase family protein n=1 Tax=Arthrobacter koreensis TaxID=199136 RepID=UPI002DB9ACB9|nr:hypothetical protein [Arthrobacter koreensis]